MYSSEFSLNRTNAILRYINGFILRAPRYVRDVGHTHTCNVYMCVCVCAEGTHSAVPNPAALIGERIVCTMLVIVIYLNTCYRNQRTFGGIVLR